MSALGPQKQLGTPPMGGRKMAAMLKVNGFGSRPSGAKVLLFWHAHRRYYCPNNLKFHREMMRQTANVQLGAVQKRANLVELEKSCKTSLSLQKAASIQPRTDLPKFGAPTPYRGLAAAGSNQQRLAPRPPGFRTPRQ